MTSHSRSSVNQTEQLHSTETKSPMEALSKNPTTQFILESQSSNNKFHLIMLLHITHNYAQLGNSNFLLLYKAISGQWIFLKA